MPRNAAALAHLLACEAEAVVVVVEGATPATLVTGAITMIIIGILLNVVGLGVICWALFTLTIHALPFFVGMIAGIYIYQSEQVRAAPSSLASSQAVSRSWSGSTLSPSSVLPLCTLSLGFYCASRRTCRLQCNPRPCSYWCFPGLVAGGARHFLRHHRRMHRLGARVDPDRARSGRGRCPRPNPVTDSAATKGR
jgi:hypothetical protein